MYLMPEPVLKTTTRSSDPISPAERSVFKAAKQAAASGHEQTFTSADFASNGDHFLIITVQYFSKIGFHHPWRSTAREVHPVMKVDVIE
jgi:hypothetical protein